ncbi:DUF6798 domain-containing protein [Candidatus Entotheonella palauensis]|uniref:DUF6798 domain-containing protein n=1 Tax=Candidatus Entotheonella palauensis TaxID=93172 RepID=UPI002A4E1E13|nr:DUF6798 domain-containing protein [Candidatus Entotheonella palauensis]
MMNAVSHHLSTKRYGFAICVAILILCVLILKAGPVPYENEEVYLLALIKQWQPDFLPHDWMYDNVIGTHFVFNTLFGWLARRLPLEYVGWLGRLLCWAAILTALLRLGLSFRIPLWMATVAIALWLLYDQSLVAHSWMLETFEAKCLAYLFVLLALIALQRQQERLAAIGLGIAFSFHASVGLLGGTAAYLSLIALRYDLRRLGICAGLTILFALPGAIPILSHVLEDTSTAYESWKFIALVRAPRHLDPFSWDRMDILSSYILLLFNIVAYKQSTDTSNLKIIILFQIFLCLIFSFGLLLSRLEAYHLLKPMPFRLFPLFVLLFFFFHLMALLHHHATLKISPAAIALGICALLCLSHPFEELSQRTRKIYRSWTTPEDHLTDAFRWVAENTPRDAVAILPPWRSDSFYIARRAQIANWKLLPYGRIETWRERLEALGGNHWDEMRQMPHFSLAKAMAQHYNNLPAEAIAAIQAAYGGDYLVSRNRYRFPVLYDTGTYRVYQLTGVSG